MNGTPSLDDLLALKRRPTMDPLGRQLDPAVAAARQAEKARRSNVAGGLAITALRRLHADDYNALLLQAKAKVDAEGGPLPGDEAAVAS